MGVGLLLCVLGTAAGLAEPKDGPSSDSTEEIRTSGLEESTGEPTGSPRELEGYSEHSGTDTQEEPPDFFPPEEAESDRSAIGTGASLDNTDPDVERRLELDDEPASFAAPRPLDDDLVQRRGGFIAVSVGISNCGSGCPELTLGGAGRMEGGYRWPHIAVGASVSFGGGQYDTVESDEEDIVTSFDADGSLRYLHFGPFVQAHFVSTGQVDPFVALGFGYHRLTDVYEARIDQTPFAVRYWESSLGVRVGAGAPIFVGERVTLGPRFDYVFPLGGQQCSTVDGMPVEAEPECVKWSDSLDDRNDVDRRLIRRSRLRPWSLALELRVAF